MFIQWPLIVKIILADPEWWIEEQVEFQPDFPLQDMMPFEWFILQMYMIVLWDMMVSVSSVLVLQVLVIHPGLWPCRREDIVQFLNKILNFVLINHPRRLHQRLIILKQLMDQIILPVLVNNLVMAVPVDLDAVAVIFGQNWPNLAFIHQIHHLLAVLMPDRFLALLFQGVCPHLQLVDHQLLLQDY